MKLNRPKYKNFEPGQFPTRADGFDLCELKYDGWWGQLLLEGHHWKLFSRTGQLKKQGTLANRYGRTLIHGEYLYGTEWSLDHPEYYNQLVVFGATELSGADVSDWTNAQQRFLLYDLLRQLREEEILGGLFLIRQYVIREAPVLWAMNEEFEGLVFKNSQAPWGAPFGRMKRAVTMDYVCMGFEQSDADRHRGWGVASVIGGLLPAPGEAPVPVCKVSTLTDKQREEFYNESENFVGRVFEAQGKKITKRGSLRHPDFVRWRDDKTTDDCVWTGVK